MKKIVACLSALLLVACMAALSEADESKVLQSGDYQYSILDDGTAEITVYLGSETELIIPLQLDGLTVTVIGDKAFSSRRDLTSVAIPDSVTKIGEGAFSSCYKLASVQLP